MTEDYAARAIAFFLPQFHPIPENDEWWGPGFTEWTNAAQGAPAVPGPPTSRTLPADLGFYDLRLPETREAQAALAAAVRRRGVLLLALLVRRRRRLLERPFTRGAGERRARRPVLPRLGQPDLDRHLARRRGPGADGADLPGRRGRPGATSTRSLAGVPRRALPPRRRPAGLLRLPARGAARTPPQFVDRWQQMARAGRPRRPLPRGGVQRPPRRAGRSTRGASRTASTRPSTSGSPPGPSRATSPRCALAASCSAVSRSTRTPASRCRCPPARRRPLRCRRSTRTGTTRLAPGAAAWRCTAPRRRSSGRTCGPRSTRSRPGRPTSGCSGSSPGTSGPRATTSSPTCEFGHGWLQVLHEELTPWPVTDRAADRDDLVLPAEREQDRRGLPGPRPGDGAGRPGPRRRPCSAPARRCHGARYGHRLVASAREPADVPVRDRSCAGSTCRRTTSCTRTATTTGCGGGASGGTSAPSTVRASRRRCTSAARWSGPAW